ncbi:hypothetical protein MUK70_18055 [Dyadobacter chenwenxiniae]|uniref:Uncharacterized protein n=1 Tax=Dyadobacter chenwenxiniae TaxID=2906456 RepID=A0A9X1PIU8_9BACT|nr:hypothetical protein [Dyadobacter chenwenxiniae]MCF0061145.1 hypothetical protein [Dyadobacter chenwenxiniae]UON80972.1 hypothetical protein MUK70_18055 [Dyadobacter chenwenxiniae]
MKKAEKKWSDFVPEVEIDPSLAKYRSISLFPEKVAKAKESLKNSFIPEIMRPKVLVEK